MRVGLSTAAGVRSVRVRVARILSKLALARPDAHVELDHRNPFELLVATILSAQCTDQRVNQVTPALFRCYARPKDLAEADPTALEALIKPTGFYKSKARSLMAAGVMLIERFGGQVPKTMEELVQLPGVGRKTANVILGHCFGQPGIVVDTHVRRVSGRLGLTTSEDPAIIEEDLQRLIPQEQWTSGSQLILLHGRYVCVAKKPKCEQCPIYIECPWEGKRVR